MRLDIGTILGHYEILAALGAGGMGEVYRAKDTELRREVAIKVLPEGFAEETERLARFEREARLLASLNHPNIATLHGFETYRSEAGVDIRFLVMELVSGGTLADRIDQGAIPVGEALPLFLQISAGLEAAHGAGVVHRDLKPGNIQISEDDVSGESRVKILDFGLAKNINIEAEASGSDLSQSPTLTVGATVRGQILGTVAYMSPEQAKGRTVDRRTDIWAFGVCLYEALTAGRGFTRDDAADTLAAVLTAELDWQALPTQAGAPLRRLLHRCLEKDPRRRLHDIADARLELEETLFRTRRTGRGKHRPTTDSRQVLPWALFGLTAVALIASLALSFLKS